MLLAIVSWAFLPVTIVYAQSSLTENTLKLDEQATSPSANIEDLGWLHGFWSGTGLGGQVDESWGAPAAGSMFGTFRLIKDDALEFSEYQEIAQVDGSLMLKVKHFDPEFKGWETREKFVPFRLVKLDEKAIYFEGATYKLENGKLKIFVAMKTADGFREGRFVLQRSANVSGTLAVGGEAGQNQDIEIPSDPNTVILTYNTKGGNRVPTPADFEPTPLVRVFANGMIITGRHNPKRPELEFQLGKEQLEELLQFVVNEKGLSKMTTQGLKDQIEASGKKARVSDAPTDIFSLNLANGKHEVEFYGLQFLRHTHKDIEDIQSLVAIRDKMMFLHARAALGTQEEVDQLVKDLTKAFAKRFSEGEALTLDDLKNASVNKDGSIQAQFSRMIYETNGQPKYLYNCYVQRKNGKNKINCTRSLIR